MDTQKHERILDVCERLIITLYDTYNAAILGMIEELDSEFGKSHIVFECDYVLYISSHGGMCRLERVVAPISKNATLKFLFRPIQDEGESSFAYGPLGLDLDKLRGIANYFMKELKNKSK